MLPSNVLVIGSGIMGSSVASLLASYGYSTTVFIHQSALDKVQQDLKLQISKIIQKQKLSLSVDDIFRAIDCVTDIPQKTFSLIFEAVPENLELKKKIIQDFNKVATHTSIWATSTSSLSVTDMSTVYSWPERFIGLHFFNPVSVMELVEIVPSMLTSSETLKEVFQLAKNLNKYPIRVEDSPGFIVNRLLIPLINEAITLLENGVASPEEIDQAMQYGAHHPMGPLALADLIGNDICLSIMETLYNTTCDSKYRPSYLLRKMVSAKKLGRKTGEGFYKYNTGKKS